MKTTNLTGSQIRELRNELGMKQQQCADAIGVNIRTWQKYESGFHNCKQIYIDIIKRESAHVH